MKKIYLIWIIVFATSIYLASGLEADAWYYTGANCPELSAAGVPARLHQLDWAPYTQFTVSPFTHKPHIFLSSGTYNAAVASIKLPNGLCIPYNKDVLLWSILSSPSDFGELDCNDNISDDNDNLIDMKDPDCTVRNAAHYLWDCMFAQQFSANAWFNASAVDGADGCCGDDMGRRMSCIGTPTVTNCNQITDLTTCTVVGCSVSSPSCTGKSLKMCALTPECQISSTIDGFCQGSKLCNGLLMSVCELEPACDWLTTGCFPANAGTSKYAHAEVFSKTTCTGGTLNWIDIKQDTDKGFCTGPRKACGFGDCSPSGNGCELSLGFHCVGTLFASVFTTQSECTSKGFTWHSFNDPATTGMCVGVYDSCASHDMFTCNNYPDCRVETATNKCKGDSTNNNIVKYGSEFSTQSACQAAGAGIEWKTFSCDAVPGTTASCANPPSVLPTLKCSDLYSGICDKIDGCNWRVDQLLNLDENYVAPTGQQCVRHDSIPKWLYCGDGAITGNEQCDNGAAINNNSACMTDCKNAKCGDGFVYTGVEQCDDGNSNNNDGCMNNCKFAFCGDKLCTGAENAQTCFKDCGIDGWHTDDDGWSWNPTDKILVVNKSNSVAYSDFIDIKPDKRYSLSGKAYSASPTCIASIFIDGKCFSIADAMYKDCFTPITITASLSGSSWITLSKDDLNIPTNGNVSNGHFNNVKISLKVTGCDNNVSFDDISLKEVSYQDDLVHYDYIPSGIEVSACCPSAWCWNGTACMNSESWMNNSLYPPIWNNIFNITWRNSHVNASRQSFATGYRCVGVGGVAEWVPARIKYDWSFSGSGYCNNDSDCFVVAKDANGNPKDFGGSRAGCIHSGEFISDTYELDKGDHYCNNGVWSTRTELMANFLASTAADKSFILFCDNQVRNLYNNKTELPSTMSAISAACTIVIKNSQTDEQIITAFAVDGNDEEVINDLVNVYTKTGIDPDGTCNVVFSSSWEPTAAYCDTTSSAGILKCVGFSSSTLTDCPTTRLKIYYNTTSRYYILADKDIQTFNPNFWTIIRTFFQKLFGINPKTPDVGFINQTTNFNNLYVIKNNQLNVYAVQENKYDELTYDTFYYIFANYSGITQSDPINAGYINKSVLNFSMNTAGNSKEIFIKTNQGSWFWTYFTAILRDRDPVPLSIPN